MLLDDNKNEKNGIELIEGRINTNKTIEDNNMSDDFVVEECDIMENPDDGYYSHKMDDDIDHEQSQYNNDNYYNDIEPNFYCDEKANVDFFDEDTKKINDEKNTEGSNLSTHAYHINSNTQGVGYMQSHQQEQVGEDNQDYVEDINIDQKIQDEKYYAEIDQVTLTGERFDHKKMIDNDNYYLRNKDYFYKDQYYPNMHNKQQDNYMVPNQPDDGYFDQDKCYEKVMPQGYPVAPHYRTNMNEFYNEQAFQGTNMCGNELFNNNYGEYYNNYEHERNHSPPDEALRGIYYEPNDKALMERESYFDSFHQTPHGELKNTYYNPFVIKHRRRTSKMQLRVLEKTFETNVRPDAALRKILGEQLGMTPRSVQVWFQNRRAKIKKNKKREDERGRTKHKPESLHRSSNDKNFYNHTSSMYFSPISPQDGQQNNQEERIDQREKNMYDNSSIKDLNPYGNSNFLNH